MIDRENEAAAQRIIEHIVPDRDQRRIVLETMANVINVLHATSPGAWSVTLRRRQVTVNSAVWAVFTLRSESIWLGYVDDQATGAVRSALADGWIFRSSVDNRFGWIPIEIYLAAREEFDAALLSAVKALAANAHSPRYRDSHSPNVLEYLERELGRPIPRPQFANGNDEESTDDSVTLPAGVRHGEPEYWKISPGEDARLWSHWLEEEVATIGWDDFGDLGEIDEREFKQRYDDLKPTHPDWSVKGTHQLWRFSQIPVGSYLVANRGTTEVLGIGRVTGSYFFDPSVPEYRHRLPVEWLDTTRRTVDQPGWKRTLVRLPRELFESICDQPSALLEERGVTEPASTQSITSTFATLLPPYSLDDFAKETGLEPATLRQWVAAIDRKGQAILYGPPGTGKTYSAERFARHLAGGTDGFVDLVQFHPAYTYEEFIQGIRPRVGSSGVLEYPTMPGRFLDFIAKADQRSGPAVPIIDEINRANLSRVFGELMYLLEYRDRPVPLAGGGTLSIPSNVRMIGTMNTADRSIALVDHALRRRFAFLELPTNYDVLEEFHENGAGRRIASVLREVNSQIESHYQIGISYFLHHDIERHLETIWRTEIEPYLEEYFFDRDDTIRRFRWSAIASRIQP